RFAGRSAPRAADYVRNGQRMTIDSVASEGTIIAATPDGQRSILPAGYVHAHVQLSYASTVHRAQGMTVDTAHLVPAPGLDRETLYGGMTRGRIANHAYIATDATRRDDCHTPPPGVRTTPRQALSAIIDRSGADTAAHTALQQLWNPHGPKHTEKVAATEDVE